MLDGGDQRVPHPGTALARIVDLPAVAAVAARRLVRLGGGDGRGEGQEDVLEQGSVLGGTAALDPDPAAPSEVIDR
jgi:hypothetical protein